MSYARFMLDPPELCFKERGVGKGWKGWKSWKEGLEGGRKNVYEKG